MRFLKHNAKGELPTRKRKSTLYVDSVVKTRSSKVTIKEIKKGTLLDRASVILDLDGTEYVLAERDSVDITFKVEFTNKDFE